MEVRVCSYLAWVADVNQEYEDYQAAAGTAYVTQVGNVTAASTARWTSIAGFSETCVIAEAGAHETYYHAMAGHRETYLVAAQAKFRGHEPIMGVWALWGRLALRGGRT